MMDYKDIEKRMYDSQQYILNNDGSISVNPLKCAVKPVTENFEMLVLCPFCLETNQLHRFKLEKGLRVCPICTNKLKLKTLTEIDDLDKFVKFVFDYRFNGFWQKIFPNFEEWNKKLYQLKLSKDFWEKYRNMKGE